MHRYRTHTCGALRESDIGAEVRLSGWCHRVRDHGGVLFIDLRDHYGLAQVVADPDSPAFKAAETLRSEWVVRIDGKVRRRPAGTENPDLPTGAVEVYIRDIEVLGPAGELPMPVFGDQEYPEDIRLKYRFLDLRREHLHQNIMKRGAIIDSIRRRMKAQGFFEHGFIGFEYGHRCGTGDRVYGLREPGRAGAPRQMLHARRLGFPHPRSGEPVAAESPLPEDFAKVLAALRTAKKKRPGRSGPPRNRSKERATRER